MTAARAAFVPALRAILGADAIRTAPGDVAPYVCDHRGLYRGCAAAVVLPRSVEEVSQVLALCAARRIGVVPQGGNTGYCGGATPDRTGGQLVLALRRLKRIRCVDAALGSLIAEAGCTLAQVQQAAEEAGACFPLRLGSQGTCQIGGNLSTNAGGVSVLRYDMMRDLVLGLEVVLPDGRVLGTLSGLRKDNTGYDIRALFLGAEGTLGVITAASLKLFAPERARSTALAAVPEVGAAVQLLGELRAAAGGRLSSFELIPRAALELAIEHIAGVTDPLQRPYPWYVLCELGDARTAEALDALLEETLTSALGRGLILDAALAHNAREREALWRMRESIPEAQRRHGAGLKHDIAVPVAALGEFVATAAQWVSTHVPEGMLVAYGHAGDGNLHFNISQRPQVDGARLLGRAAQVQRAIHDLAHDFGGSFSAEHGIGQLKVGELERYAPPPELALMRAVERAFDPRGIMNPGKVLRRAVTGGLRRNRAPKRRSAPRASRGRA